MRDKNLLDRFLSKSNFLTAYNRVASKKSAGGVDGVSVEAFGKHLYKNIKKLMEQIRSRTYTPQPVQSTYMPKFNEENEWRELGLPSVADKVVQAALFQVVEPIAEKLFLDTSYGYRSGKGHYKAIRRVEHNLRHDRKWVVNRDIDNFFDSLNHDLLIGQFSDLVKGEPLLTELVVLWCRMGLVEKNGRWRNVQAGVRQGNIISPLLSNLYLHPLDKFATGCSIGWVRYADNFLSFCNSREEAKNIDGQILEFLSTELSLRVNKDDRPVSNIEEGFTFLGIHFRGEQRSIAQQKINKIQKKIKWLLSGKNADTPSEIILRLTRITDGLKRYYGFLNPGEQFSTLDRLLEESFISLVACKMKEGRWGIKHPEEVCFPRLNSGNDPAEGLKKMQSLWKKAVNINKQSMSEDVKKTVDAKVSRKRKKHLRQQVQSGELVVTTPGHFIGIRGERIIVRMKQNIIAEVPVIKLSGLSLSSKGVSLSGDVVTLCIRKNIYIHFVDNIGRITALISPPGGAAGDISLQQIKERDTEKGISLARMFVLGKVKNQFALLKYYHKYPINRENGFGKELRGREVQIKDLINKINKLDFHNEPEHFRHQLMGLEGSFATHYWAVVKRLFNNGITFEGRERQGAKDLVNSSLNYGYGVLYSHILNAVLKAGLNPMAGFLHSYQPQKPVLTYDMIEEFRPMAADRAILTLLRRGEKIEQEDDGLLTADSRKKIAKAVHGRLVSEVDFQGRKRTIETVIQAQAINVKKHISGAYKYRPFLSRW